MDSAHFTPNVAGPENPSLADSGEVQMDSLLIDNKDDVIKHQEKASTSSKSMNRTDSFDVIKTTHVLPIHVPRILLAQTEEWFLIQSDLEACGYSLLEQVGEWRSGWGDTYRIPFVLWTATRLSDDASVILRVSEASTPGGKIVPLSLSASGKYATPRTLRSVEEEIEFFQILKGAGSSVTITEWMKFVITFPGTDNTQLPNQSLNILVLEQSGTLLQSYLDLCVPLNVEDFLRLAMRITDAVGALHASGIVHGNISPNVFLYDQGNDKLRVLNLAHAVPSSGCMSEKAPYCNMSDLNRVDWRRMTVLPDTYDTLDKADVTMAPTSPVAADSPIFSTTAGFISPEVASGRPVDCRSDLFSIGVVFFYNITGCLPFEVDDYSEYFSEVVHFDSSRIPQMIEKLRGNKVPRAIVRIIQKLMSNRPEDRYQSAYGLRFDIELCFRYNGKRGKLLILPLKLGEYDVVTRFGVAAGLYGREKERDLLLSRVTSHLLDFRQNKTATGQLYLFPKGSEVGVDSGVGRTALILSVIGDIEQQSHATPSSASTKILFNLSIDCSIHAHASFSVIVSLFHQVGRKILESGCVCLQHYKKKFRDQLSSVSSELINNLFPEISFVMGIPESDNVSLSLNAWELHFPLAFVCGAVSDIICDGRNEIVIFFRNFELLHVSAVQMLRQIFKYGGTTLFAAVDTNSSKDSPSRRLMAFLGRLQREKSMEIYNFKVVGPTMSGVADMIKNSGFCPSGDALLLHSVCHQTSSWLIVKLRCYALYKRRVIVWNPSVSSWMIDSSLLSLTTLPSSLVELVNILLELVSSNARVVASVISCIGGCVATQMIQEILDWPRAIVNAAILELAAIGVMTPALQSFYLDAWGCGFLKSIYKYDIDYCSIHSAIINVISAQTQDSLKTDVAIKVGMILHKNRNYLLPFPVICRTVLLMNRYEICEKSDVGFLKYLLDLNILMANIARSMCAFTVAIDVLQKAHLVFHIIYEEALRSKIVGDDKSSFDDNKTSTSDILSVYFDINYLLCELFLAVGDSSKARALLGGAFSKHGPPRDATRFHLLKCFHYCRLKEWAVGIKSCLESLRSLNVDLVEHPEPSAVITMAMRVMLLLDNFRENISSYSATSISKGRLRLAQSKELPCQMACLFSLLHACNTINRSLFAITAGMMVELSLEFGITAWTAYGCVCFASYLAENKHIHSAQVLLRVSTTILGLFPNSCKRGQVELVMAQLRSCFLDSPITDVIDVIHLSVELSLVQGDGRHALHATCVLFSLPFSHGISFATSHEKLDMIFRIQVDSGSFTNISLMSSVTRSFRRCNTVVLQPTVDVKSMNFDELLTYMLGSDDRIFDDAAPSSTRPKPSELSYLSIKQRLSCRQLVHVSSALYVLLYPRPLIAMLCAEMALPYSRFIHTEDVLLYATFLFFYSLSLCVLYGGDLSEKATILDKIQRNQGILYGLVVQVRIASLFHSVVDAFVSSNVIRDPGALTALECCVKTASASGWVHVEALCLEEISRQYLLLGLKSGWRVYAHAAAASFEKWGITWKLRQMVLDDPPAVIGGRISPATSSMANAARSLSFSYKWKMECDNHLNDHFSYICNCIRHLKSSNPGSSAFLLRLLVFAAEVSRATSGFIVGQTAWLTKNTFDRTDSALLSWHVLADFVNDDAVSTFDLLQQRGRRIVDAVRLVCRSGKSRFTTFPESEWCLVVPLCVDGRYDIKTNQNSPTLLGSPKVIAVIYLRGSCADRSAIPTLASIKFLELIAHLVSPDVINCLFRYDVSRRASELDDFMSVRQEIVACCGKVINAELGTLMDIAEVALSSGLDRKRNAYLQAIVASSNSLMAKISELFPSYIDSTDGTSRRPLHSMSVSSPVNYGLMAKAETAVLLSQRQNIDFNLARSSSLQSCLSNSTKIDGSSIYDVAQENPKTYITAIDIRTTVKSWFASLACIADDKGIELTCEVDQNVPQCFMTSPDHMNELLRYILQDIIRSTSPGSSIVVKTEVLLSCEETEGAVVFSEEIHFRIEISDEHVSDARCRVLYREVHDNIILKAFGGCVWYERPRQSSTSDNESNSILFILMFPNLAQKSTSVVRVMNASLPPLPLRSAPRILVAEFSASGLKSLCIYLKSLGYTNIDTANTGLEAFQSFKSELHDIIIVNVMLDGLSGIELARNVRIAFPERNVTIIGLSSKPHYHVYAIRSGMDAFFSKPLSFSRLYHTLSVHGAEPSCGKDSLPDSFGSPRHQEG